jgi:ubiquinone/menaquinone biosynthesis C-methylase UbiE
MHMTGRMSFDAHAERYDAWFERHPFAYQSELQAIGEPLPIGGKGLEIGVGSGLFAGPLGIRQGIDPSDAMLTKARSRGIDAVRGVAESLPFSDEEFDFCLMVTTVCFLDDIELAFREACRVLKQSGAFIIGFVDKNSPIGKSYEERKQDSLFYRDATFHAVDELVRLLTNAGFKRFSFRQTLFSPVADMREPAPVTEGHGKGSFVAIRAEK